MYRYLIFRTIEDLLYDLRGGHAILETEIDSNEKNVINVSVLDRSIARITYRTVTIEGEKNKMIAVSRFALEFLYVFDDNKNFVVEIAQSKDVKEINLTEASISFIYKDRYAVKLYPRSVNNLEIKDLKTSQFKFATLSHFSEVFETLDKHI